MTMDRRALLAEKLAGGKPAILLVDDDTHIIDTLKDILEDFGYAVQSAGTQAQALERLSSEAFHLTVVDYTLPDGRGLGLAEQILQGYAPTKVILMTGYALGDLEKEMAKIPLFACLTKPVDPQALMQKLQQALAELKREMSL